MLKVESTVCFQRKHAHDCAFFIVLTKSQPVGIYDRFVWKAQGKLRHNPMHMSDYVKCLDNILSAAGEQLLLDNGKISHKQAIEKATAEYKRFIVNNLSPVEESYLTTIKNLEQTIKTAEENATKHKNGK